MAVPAEGPAWHGPDAYIREYEVTLASDVDFTSLSFRSLFRFLIRVSGRDF